AFLRKNRSQLRQTVGSWTNANPILVEYILEELTDRAAEMNLYLKTSTHETLLATLCMLTYEVALLSTTKRGIRIPF
ncbi:MAG: hypothetical protein KDD70_07775, partial [Bdellovibrionales bacterium]|nr:hypothetical protein [Bdellovibrionales bacterium]